MKVYSLQFAVYSILFLFTVYCLLLALCYAQEEKLITAIEIKGNKAISITKIISQIKSRVGSPYIASIVSDDLKRLYATGFFEDVKVETEDFKEGVKLIFEVKEKPIIEKITFIGQRRIREQILKEEIKSKDGQFLDYPLILSDLEILKKLYERRGFSQAKIDYTIEISPETNKAKVQFKILEGGRIKIGKLFIKGNKSFSHRRIVRLMKTRPSWFFRAGVYKEDVLKEDIERIKSFYQKEGFVDIKVDYNIGFHPKKGFILVNIDITEGKKYIVGDIYIKGNKDIVETDIRKRLTECISGKVFSGEAISKDILNISGLYFDKGYIFTEIKEITYLNPKTDRVDITFNIIENQICYVNLIKIKGNTKTKDVVIRRELRIKPGERFDGEKLRRSKERLMNLGFFEEISYDTESTKEPNKRDLVVQVKETKTGEFSFGGGYSSMEEFIGFLEIRQRNFDWRNFPYFTGAGQDLTAHLEFGTVSQNLEISFTEPWIFGYPVSFGFDGYRRAHERETDIGYGYEEKRTGGDLRLGRELTDFLRIDSKYRLEEVEISDIPTGTSAQILKEWGKNTISSLGLSLTYDTRDNIFNPTKGWVISGTWECAGGLFGGDKDFLKFQSRISKYFPLLKRSVLETKLRMGIIDAYGDSEDVPIYERFFAGGTYTIRGYRERRISPLDPQTQDLIGGESMLIGNLEYTFPLIEFVKGAIFFDTGRVWEKVEDSGSGDFKSSCGLGLRVKTPLGPVRLDYGYPFNKEPGEEKKQPRFHFSVGTGF